MMKKILFGLTGLLLIISCEENLQDNTTESSESEFDRLHHAGEITGGLDPFTLIDQPQYMPVDSFGHFQNEDLVLILKKEGRVYVYPHREMYVEIVNEYRDGHPIAITFCPLTRSGLGWDRVSNTDTTLLTASGYLLRENLMPLDSIGGTIFSQMLSVGLEGDLEGHKLNSIPLIETKWATVQTFFSDALVFDSEKTLNESKQASLKSVRSSDNHYFGVSGLKGIMLFSYNVFPGDIVAHSIVGSKNVNLVVGSENHRYIVAFSTKKYLKPVPDAFPVILEDEAGSRWNIFGEAISGPRKGEQLEFAEGFVAYDWAWQQLFNEVKIFDPEMLGIK